MTNSPKHSRLCSIIFTFTVLFCHRHGASAQTVPVEAGGGSEPPPAATALLAAQERSSLDSVADALPDAPGLQQSDVKDEPQAPSSQHDQTHINSIALLSPRLVTGTALSPDDKSQIYIHKAYSPAAVIYPLIGAGFRMINPPDAYPKEWKDGMGAFGRNYGNAIAQRTASTTADFGTQILLHEDPRYRRSDSSNPIMRLGHAIAWTFFDENDSGHRTLAVSTFSSAAAGGFVGMAYLPDGYNDVTHAEQRMVREIGDRAISNILTEFEPVWGPWAAKLKVPKLLPEWWVPAH